MISPETKKCSMMVVVVTLNHWRDEASESTGVSTGHGWCTCQERCLDKRAEHGSSLRIRSTGQVLLITTMVGYGCHITMNGCNMLANMLQ